MSEWKQYRRRRLSEMRPYVYGEDLTEISVSAIDDPRNDMGMIARNPKNHSDQWYVARQYFEDNLEPVEEWTIDETDCYYDACNALALHDEQAQERQGLYRKCPDCGQHNGTTMQGHVYVPVYVEGNQIRRTKPCPTCKQHGYVPADARGGA